MNAIPSHAWSRWSGLLVAVLIGGCDPIAAIPGGSSPDFPAVVPDTISDPSDGTPIPTCGDEGSFCDDGDLCTVDDRCVADSCQGAPVDCTDDAPCTEDLCAAGICEHPVLEGSCHIEDTCWTALQPNPTNVCLACAPSLHDSAWSPQTGECDDGDACTTGDACQEGACMGDPLCPPGTDPCTAPTCVAGVCESSPVDGADCDDGDSCTVADSCAGGVCTPGPPLDADEDDDPPVACGGGDCNDQSSTLSSLVAEVCGDGMDNDCDGDTDEGDSDCTPDPVQGCTDPTAINYDPNAEVDDGSCESDPFPSCAYQKDCEGGAQVCGAWAADGETRCSPPCAGPSDCGDGFVCSKLEGSAQIGYCHIPPAGALASGQPCASGESCASGLCIDAICRDLCMNEAACGGGGHTCVMLGDLAAGWVIGVCVPTPAGTQPIGAACGAGDDIWTGAVCSTNHCDLLPYPAAAWYCAPLCVGVSDCMPGQECGLVIYADIVAPGSVPMSATVPYATRTGATGCYTAPASGPLNLGSACGGHGECASALCATMGDPAINRCTSFCALDADCAGGAVPMGCRTSAIPLWSTWLADPTISQPINSDAYTLVRVCQAL